eukprot:112384-Prymnesium_polylepis.1
MPFQAPSSSTSVTAALSAEPPNFLSGSPRKTAQGYATGSLTRSCSSYKMTSPRRRPFLATVMKARVQSMSHVPPRPPVGMRTVPSLSGVPDRRSCDGTTL